MKAKFNVKKLVNLFRQAEQGAIMRDDECAKLFGGEATVYYVVTTVNNSSTGPVVDGENTIAH